MLKREISPEIIHYTFKPVKGKKFANSITALIDDNKVLLIDAAYEEQASLLFEELNNHGQIIEKIIISHFHDDHMQGLKALPKTVIYGSMHYKTTLDLWTESKEHKHFIPTNLIDEQLSMNFGRHKLSIIPFPGHSLCTVIIKINDRYVHIADELMFSIDGKPLLPSTEPNCIERHIESLKKLKEFSSYILIPSHGEVFCGIEKIEKDIDNRITYFKAILNSKKRISYEEAVIDCDCEFVHSEWHDFIYG
jgi:glyoxylase-like metal-dependent hydrolase (beta-lactamase superfamily II)